LSQSLTTVIMWWLVLLAFVIAVAIVVKYYEETSRRCILGTNGTAIQQYASIMQCLKQLALPLQRIHQCEFHLQLSRIYDGNPFLYFLAHIPVVVFSNHDHVRTINLQWKNLEKTTQFLNPHARKMLGANVVFANGDDWSMMRAIMDPAFYNAERFIPLMESKSTKCLEIASRLPQPVNVSQLMTALTLDVLGEAVLGYDFCCLDTLEESNTNISRRNRLLLSHYHYMMKESANVLRIIGGGFVAGLPITSNYKLQEAMKAIGELIQQIIDNCRKDGASYDGTASLLEMMIAQADNQNDGPFTDEHIRSNVIVFLVAGHDTTSTALSFATYILAKMPHIQQKLREQVLENGINSNYLDIFVKENLRLYPPGPTSILRKATKPLVIGGIRIPQGQHIECSYYAMQRDIKVWGDDADEFRPERFENSNGRPQHSYSPFSSGARACLGQRFSVIEQKIFLRNVVSQCNLTLSDPDYNIRYMDQGPLLAVDRNLAVNFYNVH
jgi:cytochrome P450